MRLRESGYWAEQGEPGGVCEFARTGVSGGPGCDGSISQAIRLRSVTCI